MVGEDRVAGERLEAALKTPCPDNRKPKLVEVEQ